MAFRDELEAARERVVALERNVANARARKETDRLRVMELMIALDAGKPRPQEAPRQRRNSAAIIIVNLIIIGCAIAAVVSRSSPESVPGSKYAIELKDSLRKKLPADSRIVSIDASLVDRSGRAHVHPGHPLVVEYVSPEKCERMEWRSENGLFVQRSATTCPEVKVPVIHCSPYQVHQRIAALNLGFDEYAELHWQNGIWTARKWNGGPLFTIYDDCDRRFWP